MVQTMRFYAPDVLPELRPVEPMPSVAPAAGVPQYGGSQGFQDPAPVVQPMSGQPEATPSSPSTAIVRAWPGPMVKAHRAALPSELDPRFVILRRRSSPHAQAFRLLRHRLFAHGDPRVIAVISAGAGEGRTTCAVNLASVLAEEASTHVLLVEANTRSPIFARLFQAARPPDLGRRLQTTVDSREPWPVMAFDDVNLHVAMMSPKNVPAGLDRPMFTDFIETMRHEYDYIVMDTPAAFTSADASIATEVSDGYILAAAARSTRRRAIRRVMDQLSPVPALGLALLGVPAKEAACH